MVRVFLPISRAIVQRAAPLSKVPPLIAMSRRSSRVRAATRPLFRALTGAIVVLCSSAVTTSHVGAQDNSVRDSYAARCGAIATLDEGRGYRPLPRGDVFCPLIADPKAIRSFVSYQRGDAEDFAKDIIAVGIGDQFAFFRVSGSRPGDGVQLGLAGAVFAQFDANAPSLDLLNADYLISLPLTVRRGALSARARVYHQSSHLGDEFLLRPEPPHRENLSFESADLLLSADMGPLRAYGGGEYFFHREPAELPDALVHTGIELRPHASARLGTIALATVIAGVDVKAVNDSSWRLGVSARAGFEIGRPGEGSVLARRWSLLAEYYDGPSPYGQFHQTHIRFTGIGFHFSL